MSRCSVDNSIQRVTVDGFDFPLGVYPVEEMQPKEGFTLNFESADGGDDPEDEGEGEWEEWPDRYVWDINIRSARLEGLIRQLFAMLPGRVFPILDVLGNDAHREIDPYVAYELVGQERFLEGVRRFRGYLLEDGLVGFGAMSDDPFIYVFIDEHKIVTVRAEVQLKDRIDKVLAAFDLEGVPTIAGADAAAHEHRGVLEAPENRPDLLTADEIVEELRDLWGLALNIDGEGNVDDEGAELGITPWRLVLRSVSDDGQFRYAEAILTADSLHAAQELGADALASLLDDADSTDFDPESDDEGPQLDVMSADRLTTERLAEALRNAAQTTRRGNPKVDLQTSAVWSSRWMD